MAAQRALLSGSKRGLSSMPLLRRPNFLPNCHFPVRPVTGLSPLSPSNSAFPISRRRSQIATVVKPSLPSLAGASQLAVRGLTPGFGQLGANAPPQGTRGALSAAEGATEAARKKWERRGGDRAALRRGGHELECEERREKRRGERDEED